MLATRHLVTAAFAGFIAFDIAVTVTWQSTFVVVMAWSLTALVVCTYMARSAQPIIAALKERRWKGVVFPR